MTPLGLKRCENILVRIIFSRDNFSLKIIGGTCFTVNENYLSPVDSEILSYRHTDILLL